MSTGPTSPPDLPSENKAPPPPRSSTPIGLGFAVGAVIWLLPVAASQILDRNHIQTRDHYVPIELLILACFGLPPVSGVLVAIRKTRRFGLGLLLACGLGWLVLGAMCGGLLR